MPSPNKKDRKRASAKELASPAVGFGSSFAGGMAVFGLGGHWLDRKTGHEYLFTLLGIGLGLLYGAWELWKLITISNRQAERRRREQAEKQESETNEPAK
ncbi:AtpZ/AtpI family protein [Pontiellaceae bacterium B12227]|nr:AtpZ/AtpI family protein [Pontiellaceae bacterium B12227]